jgi:hypothetical protein
MIRNRIPQNPTYVAFAKSRMLKIIGMKMMCMSPLVQRTEKYFATGCAQHYPDTIDGKQALRLFLLSRRRP